MHYFMSQFDKDGKTLTQESSSLGILGIRPGHGVFGELPNGTRGITVTDTGRGETYTFVFNYVDTDTTGEDTYGWHFRVTMDTVAKYPHMQGHRVLIIND